MNDGVLHVDSALQRCLEQDKEEYGVGNFQFGLLLGQTVLDNKDYAHGHALARVRTPAFDPDSPAKTLKDIQTTWAADHAIQVERLLPGGMSVIGVYVTHQSSLSTEDRRKLDGCITEISQSVGNYELDEIMNKENRKRRTRATGRPEEVQMARSRGRMFFALNMSNQKNASANAVQEALRMQSGQILQRYRTKVVVEPLEDKVIYYTSVIHLDECLPHSGVRKRAERSLDFASMTVRQITEQMNERAVDLRHELEDALVKYENLLILESKGGGVEIQHNKSDSTGSEPDCILGGAFLNVREGKILVPASSRPNNATPIELREDNDKPLPADEKSQARQISQQKAPGFVRLCGEVRLLAVSLSEDPAQVSYSMFQDLLRSLLSRLDYLVEEWERKLEEFVDLEEARAEGPSQLEADLYKRVVQSPIVAGGVFSLPRRLFVEWSGTSSILELPQGSSQIEGSARNCVTPYVLPPSEQDGQEQVQDSVLGAFDFLGVAESNVDLDSLLKSPILPGEKFDEQVLRMTGKRYVGNELFKDKVKSTTQDKTSNQSNVALILGLVVLVVAMILGMLLSFQQ